MVDARMQCLGSSDKHWLTQKVSTEGHEDRVGSWPRERHGSKCHRKHVLHACGLQITDLVDTCLVLPAKHCENCRHHHSCPAVAHHVQGDS